MQKMTLKIEPRLDAKHDAFPFQEEAVQFASEKEYSAIFYEQGLGKTKIAIDVILRWLKNKCIDTIIVVTKKGLVENWVEEFGIHSFIKPKVMTSDKRKNYFVLNSPARVIITHFEAISTEKRRLSKFLRLREVAIIVDESAKLKNPEAKLTQDFFELREGFRRRIIMTGTPVPNRPQDIWAQIFFLDGGKALGSDYSKFCSAVNLDNKLYKSKDKQIQFEEALVNIFPSIEEFCVRETKEGSGLKLPRKHFQNIFCEWNTPQRELYETIREQEKYALIREGKLSIEDAEVTIKRLTRLMQVASNPILLDETYAHLPAKFESLNCLLEGVKSTEEKAIVWTSYVNNAEWLYANLSKYNPVMIHGGVSDSIRSSSIKKFKQDPSCMLLIAVPQAAKEGLTLTVANHVIFWDRTFSLDDYLQAQDRIHRISQEKTCYITNLLMEDSIDVWVDSLLNAKALAAHLAQSDITEDEYRSRADYGYGELIRDVLNLGGDFDE